jgi:site-specific recombinase XerD
MVLKRNDSKTSEMESQRALLDNTKSYRFRALIHLLASSGVRAGAVHEMQIKDLTEMSQGCKALKVYPILCTK